MLIVCSLISLGVGIYTDVSAPPGKQEAHWVEGFAIILAVVIVVMVASVNDYQKESQFRKLNAKKEDRMVKAVRDGSVRLISVYDIMVGDILCLEPGDVISADGVVIETMNLKMDESSATGESDTITKSVQGDPFILSGSKVTEGIAKYLIVAVGEHSFFGKTMMALRTEDEDTPLQVKLGVLAEQIAKFGSSAAAIMLVSLIVKYVVDQSTKFGGFKDKPATDIIQQIVQIVISAITIVVVAVPEGLPLAVTLALAYGTKKMMKDNNLVRVISSCETMGNATAICSDKTGTLTQNKMTVVKGSFGRHFHYDHEKGLKEIQELRTNPSSLCKEESKLNTAIFFNTVFEGIAINSSAFEETNQQTKTVTFVGSKTEVALIEYARKCGTEFTQLRNSKEIRVEQVYPFSSERKLMATLLKIEHSANSHPHKDKKAIYRLHVKGASEIILKSCDKVALMHGNPTHDSLVSFLPADKDSNKDYNRLIDNYAALTLRTIGLAYRDMTETEFKSWLQGPIREKIRQAKIEEIKRASGDSESSDEVKIDMSGGKKVTFDESKVQITDEDVLSNILSLYDLMDRGLHLIGIVGIEDPLRPGVTEAVKTCQKAGVVVRMVFTSLFFISLLTCLGYW